MYFGVWVLKLLKIRPAAPIETFARFQAGFLSSEDFHRFPSICMVFQRFSWILVDFHVFSWVSEHRILQRKGWTCCSYRNLCSIPGWLLVIWWLSSVSFDFHGFSSNFIDFHGFWCISGYGCLQGLKEQPAAPIETFARFQAGFLSSEDFHRVLSIFIVFHWFPSIFMHFHVF